MSKELTELWKKGELPEGWYYVKGNRAEGIYAYTAEYLNNMYRPRNGEKIIEQVPSYKEWKETEKRSWLVPEFDNEIDELNDTIEGLEKENIELKKWCEEFNALEVAKENTKLKELLKECKQWFDWYHIDTGTGKEYIESWHKKGREIHQKINQVLGEE